MGVGWSLWPPKVYSDCFWCWNLAEYHHSARITHPLATHFLAGTGDDFLNKQLQPEVFQEAAGDKLALELRMQEGYDHSYYTIA